MNTKLQKEQGREGVKGEGGRRSEVLRARRNVACKNLKD